MSVLYAAKTPPMAGTSNRWHVVAGDHAACGHARRHRLCPERIPAEEILSGGRCRRPGCREAWPAETPLGPDIPSTRTRARTRV